MRTTTSFLFAVGLFSLTATVLHAQVAINNSATNPDASAILDLKSGNTGVNKGFLPQSVALTNVNTAAPVTSPATGLIVYSSSAPTGGNGTGYYYWNGSAWASMNSNIYGSGTNNYVARWTPNGTTLGAGMIQDNGSLVSINNAPVTGTELYVNGGTNQAIEGYNTGSVPSIYGYSSTWIGAEGYAAGAGDVGIWGEDDAASGYGTYGVADGGTGAYGYSNAANYYGVYAYNAAAGGTGLRANGDTAASTYGTYDGIHVYAANDDGVYSNAFWGGLYGNGGEYGIWGQSATGVGAYVFGGAFGVYSIASAGPAIFSTSSSASADSNVGTTYGSYSYTSNGNYAGVYGEDVGVNGYGIWGVASDATGYGVYGSDYTNGATGVFGGGGTTGVYGNGGSTGVYGYSGAGYGGEFADGNGDFGVVGNETDGFGGWFLDAAGDYGRIGDALDGAAGVFDNTAGTFMYISYGSSGYITNGTKSTEVKDESNQERLLFCNESPEVMFEDYGEGQLTNGKAHITLDPLFAKNVSITSKHPLRVYVQLEGDCKGVYVTNKSANGFDVKELSQGTSYVSFQWHIICNRANEAGADRNYADKRFPVGPGAPAMAKANPRIDNKSVAKTAPNAPQAHNVAKINASNPNKETAHLAAPLMAKPQAGQHQDKN